MLLPADYTPEFESMRDSLIELAQVRRVDELLKRIVNLLAERPHIALARIWLVDRGDVCTTCRLCAECPDRTHCLHLVASAGNSSDPDNDYTRLDGAFRRFPVSRYSDSPSTVYLRVAPSANRSS